jgi:fatty-acid desaturase
VGLLVLPHIWYWAFLLVPGFLMWFSGSMINIYCHKHSGPANVKLLGFLVGGEGWHKNHHDQPANPSFRHWGDWGGHLHKLMSIK